MEVQSQRTDPLNSQALSELGALTEAAAITDRPKIDLNEYGAQYARQQRMAAARAYFNSRTDPKHRECDWTRVKECNRDAVDKVRSWTYGEKGMLLVGPTGRHKTFAFADLCQRLVCDELRDIRIYHAAEWFSRLNREVNYGSHDIESWLRDLVSRDGVAIDDFGQESLLKSREDFCRGYWFRFLDMMIGYKKPLIVTTNLSAQQMADQAGEVRGDPLVRRILDLAEPVKFL
jgi:DNA replication protein DnaC